jgi:hypothetical protein
MNALLRLFVQVLYCSIIHTLKYNTYTNTYKILCNNRLYKYEENNQQNALIVSLINLLISNYSNMFRPLS